MVAGVFLYGRFCLRGGQIRVAVRLGGNEKSGDARACAAPARDTIARNGMWIALGGSIPGA